MNNTILNNNPALSIENDTIPLINGMGQLLPETSYNFNTEVLLYNDIEYPVSREVFSSKGLQQLVNELGKLTQNQVSKTLAFMSEGFLGEKQKRVYLSSTGQKSATPTPTAKPTESSADWLPNRIKRFLAGGEAMEALSEFYSAGNGITNKTTKEDLLSIITALSDCLITEKDLTELETIKEKETILIRLESDIALIDSDCAITILSNKVTIRGSSSEALKHVMVLINESYADFSIENLQRETPLDPVNGFDIIKK